jgi:hypothetical protein
MRTAHEIAGGSADLYATYLTSSSDRGYYYTTGSGGEVQAGAPVGADSRWHGAQAMLTDLGLSPDEPVQRDQLRALMRGVSPRDGHELRPVGGNGSRVAGADLTFSAPKSLSAL